MLELSSNVQSASRLTIRDSKETGEFVEEKNKRGSSNQADLDQSVVGSRSSERENVDSCEE